MLAPLLIALILPGIRTPSHNISCFYVPVKPTARGTLLCELRHASYAKALQARCDLDWHGFSLDSDGGAHSVCTGGVLYDIGRDTPRFTTLAYGRTWRYRQFTCTSRVTGLTCRNTRGHGLVLSRESYRLF